MATIDIRDGMDVKLMEQGVEDMDKEITTTEARLHLQSLLEYPSNAQIVISETEMFVNALDKTFLCENDEVLEEVCRAVNYLCRQETT
jgi:hypothetical protein